MFVICLIVLVLVFVVPSIKAKSGQRKWNNAPQQEKWEFYLDGLRRMNWDIFQFGSYNLKDWHYNEIMEFLDRLEQGIFPVDDWKIVQADGRIKHSGKMTFDLYSVEDYISKCHELYVYPTLEKLFDKSCRDDFRNGMVTIDHQHMTVAEAREYARKKVADKIASIYNFKME